MCYANEPQDAAIDSIKANIGNLDKSQKEIERSIDSLGNIAKKVFEETQKSYNCYLSFFAGVVTLLVMILVAFTGIVVIINFKSNEKLKEEVKEELKKIKTFENELTTLKTELEEQIKNQKTEFVELKEVMKDNEMKNNKKLAEVYIILAENELDVEDRNRHFICFGNFYSVLSQVSKLGSNESVYLGRALEKFIPEYKTKKLNIPDYIPHGKFFYNFLPFIEYSKEINEEIIYDKAKLIYNKLFETFSYDEVKKAIEDFFEKAEINNKETEKKRILDLAERYKE
jgi:prefoldin subunit 5